jgi:hypothetical protein
MLIAVSSLAKYTVAITVGASLLAGCVDNGGATLAPTSAPAGMGIAHIGRAVVLNGVPITAAHPNLSLHHLVRSQSGRSMKHGLYQ